MKRNAAIHMVDEIEVLVDPLPINDQVIGRRANRGVSGLESEHESDNVVVRPRSECAGDSLINNVFLTI